MFVHDFNYPRSDMLQYDARVTCCLSSLALKCQASSIYNLVENWCWETSPTWAVLSLNKWWYYRVSFRYSYTPYDASVWFCFCFDLIHSCTICFVCSWLTLLFLMVRELTSRYEDKRVHDKYIVRWQSNHNKKTTETNFGAKRRLLLCFVDSLLDFARPN